MKMSYIDKAKKIVFSTHSMCIEFRILREEVVLHTIQIRILFYSSFTFSNRWNYYAFQKHN